MNTVTLADIPLLWRAQSLAASPSPGVATGYAALDRALGGGWPRPSLIELLCDAHGIGELRLLLGLLTPTVASPAVSSRPIVLWLSPPFELHAMGLALYGLVPADHWVCSISRPSDLTWAMTQALRSGACLTVIAWAPEFKPAALRALKLAAMTGGTVGVLFRPTRAAALASPATVRIALRSHAQSLELSILKARGRQPCTVHLEPSDADAPSSAAS